MQVLFALILALGTFLLPESPRYLVSKSRDQRALTTIAVLHGRDEDDPDVTHEYNQIKVTLDLESKLGQPTWKEMFTTYKKRSWIGIAVQALGQMSGINIVTVCYQRNFEATFN